jgi:hypothetical protein
MRLLVGLFLGAALCICATADEKKPDDKKPEKPASFSVGEFNTLHKDLMQGLLWWSIPWKTSIREARELAVKEKKPIVYWAVQGHVLSLC